MIYSKTGLCYNFLMCTFRAFFNWGRVIPCVRGDGIYQEAINTTIQLLKKGEWLRIFICLLYLYLYLPLSP